MRVPRRALVAMTLAASSAVSVRAAPDPAPLDPVPITGPASPQAALRERPPSVPDDTALVAAGAAIGEIVVRTLDIFDLSNPKENYWPFRVANKLHPRTRAKTVRRLLLFRTGDRYLPRTIVETERLLRQTGYLYDAWIRPSRYEGNRVDLEVVTRDVWTLTFGIGFGRSGGENRTRIGLEDTNILGTGKEVTIRRTSNVDRTENLYRYRDPNIAGSRVRLEAVFADNSDGEREQLLVERPFYSVDARWSAGTAWLDDDREDTLWEAGKEIDRFRHRVEAATASVGFSRGFIADRAVRWKAGYSLQRDLFAPVAGRPPQAALPEDRVLSYPWFAVEVVPGDFVRGRDLDRLVRTEDLRLGIAASAKLGWSSPAFGGDRPRAIFEAWMRFTRTPGSAQLVGFEASVSGRRESTGPENVRAGFITRYYRRDFGRHVFFGSLDLGAARRLDAGSQLLIGGDSGLRGYPLRYQSGDRRALLTVEQRFYTDWHVLQLLHVGAAAFADVGRAWFASRSDLERPWLADVGVGLRLGSSRSAKGGIVHIDVACAVNAPPGISRIQILVETKETF